MSVHDRVTGKRVLFGSVIPASDNSDFPPSCSARNGLCCAEDGSSCDMRNLNNPLTTEIGVRNAFACMNCYRTHFCDMRHDCKLVTTQEGFVCVKTGLVYESVCQGTGGKISDPVTEPNIEGVNVVSIILSHVYSFLLHHSENYDDVIKEVTEDGKFKKNVEDAVYYTFNKVFKKTQSLQKLSLNVIGQLFTQLIIGVHAKATKYDSLVIKVSRKKREDGLLKQMRFEYGNAPVVRHRF